MTNNNKKDKELNFIVYEIVDLRKKKREVTEEKMRLLQAYRKQFGKEQELSRQVNEQLNKLEKWRDTYR